MQIINPSFEIVQWPSENVVTFLEKCARTCYQSEPKEGQEPGTLLNRIIKAGHLSVIEHVSATVRLVVDRGVSHELVRHRLASYSQESTRYCNYKGKDIQFIRPHWMSTYYIDTFDAISFLDEESKETLFIDTMVDSEVVYNRMLEYGASPQDARALLPNALKTEIVMTANMREWRHVLNLRCDKAAHPDMRYIMLQVLEEFYNRCPLLFEDIYIKFNKGNKED